LNISAKCHQNRWAIPFQSWCVFWDTVYVSICQSYAYQSYAYTIL